MAAWKLKEAEADCNTVFDRAFAGEPQFVLRNGEPSLVVITFAQYEASRKGKSGPVRHDNPFEAARGILRMSKTSDELVREMRGC